MTQDGQDGRILILDDDPSIGQTIKAIAETAGLVARYTEDPDEFFTLVDGWNPTHIAIDLVMPKMDGVQVIVQLAARNCRARLIVSSGVDNRILDAAGRSAAEHGLDIIGVLSKPFSAAALRKLIADPSAAMRPATAARPSATGKSASRRAGVTSEELWHAIERKELHLVYQPKICCQSGKLAGFEALARWLHPEHGPIGPDRFIPVAETSGLIDDLTDLVLEQALGWFSAGFPEAAISIAGGRSSAAAPATQLSVNLSARTLEDDQFVERISARCAAHGVAPSRLVFELTETSAMEDPVASLGLLTRLRMKEFQLSIDDFGTGFSSMLQLVRLPFSEIKIDKSFVLTASKSRESRTVIKSIVDLGRSLGLQTTAEGVEDAETLDYLKDIGCTLAQGYHIARPMPGEAVHEWVAQHHRATG